MCCALGFSLGSLLRLSVLLGSSGDFRAMWCLVGPYFRIQIVPSADSFGFSIHCTPREPLCSLDPPMEAPWTVPRPWRQLPEEVREIRGFRGDLTEARTRGRLA